MCGAILEQLYYQRVHHMRETIEYIVQSLYACHTSFGGDGYIRDYDQYITQIYIYHTTIITVHLLPRPVCSTKSDYKHRIASYRSLSNYIKQVSITWN